MKIDAIILAGGKGSRMGSEVPKPLAQLWGKAMISHQIEYLESFDVVDNIIISLGHKSSVIKEYLEENHSDSKLLFSVENAPLGTAGGIRLAMHFTNKKFVLVFNVDNISDVDVHALATMNESSIVINKGGRRSPYGRVEIRNGYARFIEKPPLMHWTSTGWYLFEKNYIMRHLPESGSLEQDVLPYIKIRPFRHTGFIWSIDSPKEIQMAEKDTLLENTYLLSKSGMKA